MLVAFSFPFSLVPPEGGGLVATLDLSLCLRISAWQHRRSFRTERRESGGEGTKKGSVWMCLYLCLVVRLIVLVFLLCMSSSLDNPTTVSDDALTVMY